MQPPNLAARKSTRLIDHFTQEQVATAPGILNLCHTCCCSFRRDEEGERCLLRNQRDSLCQFEMKQDG